MRELYFDIDGTLLVLDTCVPKAALAAGRLETAIRSAGVGRLICVGNFVRIAAMVKQIQPDYDAVGAIFSLCGGVFADEEWFRGIVTMVSDPAARAATIDQNADWWYVDDQAEKYCEDAGLADMFRRHLGGRIFVPDANGDGHDILMWINALGRSVSGFAASG